MTRGRRYLIAAAGGGLLTLAYPNFDLSWVAWVALIPMLAASTRVRPGRGFALGFAFGLVFFGTLLSWISIVGWMAWAALVLLQATWVGLFGLTWSVASRLERPAGRVAAAAALWVAWEFARSNFPVGGFTWGQLAQSQTEPLWLLRTASLGGAWLVGFLVVAVNAALLEAGRALGTRRAGRAAVPAALAVGALALPLLVAPREASGSPAEVAIVQGNVPQNWTGTFIEKERAILASHEHLTSELAPRRPDLVVWPESSVGLDALSDPDASGTIRRSARAVDAPMIVGGNLDIGTQRYKVMAFQVSEQGDVIDSYQKTHLVPFGEYVPARGIFGWIPALDQVPRDAIAGSEPRVFDVAGGEVAPVISFEGDFGSLVRRPIADGGRLLVVATNTSTWGYSPASAQHVAFSRVRAVENGVWVVHAALSGISAFVAPDGTVVQRSPLWTPAVIVQTIRFAEGVTFYARVGDWFVWVAMAASLAALVVATRGGRRIPAAAVPTEEPAPAEAEGEPAPAPRSDA